MEFMLFVGVFLLAITIGMCLRLELKQKDSYTDKENKNIRTNQMKIIACTICGILFISLYCIICL